MNKVSLVVSIYNRADIFRRTYPTWLDKTPPDEILILDDGSTDGLDRVVAEINYPIRYTYRQKDDRWTNPAVPHNWLVKQAKGPIVLIIDPEVAFVTDGIPIIQEFYQKETNRPSSCSACETYSVQDNARFSSQTVEQIVESPYKTTLPHNPSRQPIIHRPKTPTKGYRAWWRERYIALGGKDERYIGWGYEDLDLHYRQTRLPPIGKDKCMEEITIVEFLHPPPAMTDSIVSQALWDEEGSRNIPENGIANRGKEWGMI